MKHLIWITPLIAAAIWFWPFPGKPRPSAEDEAPRAAPKSEVPPQLQNLTYAPAPGADVTILSAPPKPALEAHELRGKDGQLLLLSQASAIRACAERQMHLATARDLARLLQVWGAKGVLEERAEHVGHVMARDAGGKVDEFYYESENAKPPSPDLIRLGEHGIISASVEANPQLPSNPPCALLLDSNKVGELFLGCSGFYDLVNRVAAPELEKDNHSAAICIK